MGIERQDGTTDEGGRRYALHPVWQEEDGRHAPLGEWVDEPGHQAVAAGLAMFKEAALRWQGHTRQWPSAEAVEASHILSSMIDELAEAWEDLAQVLAQDYRDEERAGGHADCRHRGGGAHPDALCICTHPHQAHVSDGAETVCAYSIRCMCAAYQWDAPAIEYAPGEAGSAAPERN